LKQRTSRQSTIYFSQIWSANCEILYNGNSASESSYQYVTAWINDSARTSFDLLDDTTASGAVAYDTICWTGFTVSLLEPRACVTLRSCSSPL